MSYSSFWAPRYAGNRFNDHSIPLEVLEDLKALQDLLKVIARDIYLEENPDKVKVPNHFYDFFQLKLSGIQQGSAIADLGITTDTILGSSASHHFYFAKAKDKIISYVEGVSNIKRNESIPAEYLPFLKRIGKNLLTDELLDLAPGDLNKKALLNHSARNKIDAQSIEIKYRQVTVVGIVPIIDKGKDVFSIALRNSSRISINHSPSKEVLDAFENYNNGSRLKISGIGLFNSDDKLIHFERIESMLPLPPSNIEEQIGELKVLTDNWLDGEGKAPQAELIAKTAEWINNAFDKIFDPLPNIFPTPEGGIEWEWVSNTADLTVTIDATGHQSYLHHYDFNNKQSFDKILFLDNPEDLTELKEIVLKNFQL